MSTLFELSIMSDTQGVQGWKKTWARSESAKLSHSDKCHSEMASTIETPNHRVHMSKIAATASLGSIVSQAARSPNGQTKHGGLMVACQTLDEPVERGRVDENLDSMELFCVWM